MALVHKTVDVRAEVWKKLRLNAEISDVHLRDYLTYLIETSIPVAIGANPARKSLNLAAEANRHEGCRQMAASRQSDGKCVHLAGDQ